MTINNKITDGHIVTISYMDIVISTWNVERTDS